MGTVLVCGGAGFIGSNFVRQVLADTGDSVVVLDKLTYAGFLDSLADVADDPRYTFIEGDITDAGCLARTLGEHRPTAVVNFAAESHVDRSIDSPRPFLETNTVGAFEVLEACRRFLDGLEGAERSAFRVLHVSTDEVYGSLGPEGAFREDTPYAPNSPYAASKAAADHMVRAYHRTFDLPVLITNCSNNYGPYQFPEKLIPLMILNALGGQSLPIYGDGLNVRDWLFVTDHCKGILRVLHDGKIGEKYNLGGLCEKANLEVIDTICAILERERPAAENAALKDKGIASYTELKTFVPDRKGHDRRYAIDASKIRRDLGWQPEHDFESGMQTTVRWYLDNREWYEKVQARARYQRERLGLS